MYKTWDFNLLYCWLYCKPIFFANYPIRQNNVWFEFKLKFQVLTAWSDALSKNIYWKWYSKNFQTKSRHFLAWKALHAFKFSFTRHILFIFKSLVNAKAKIMRPSIFILIRKKDFITSLYFRHFLHFSEFFENFFFTFLYSTRSLDDSSCLDHKQ